ncbi:MAG: BTAD domain-containing putative transcriptional regulator [Chloroflexota bacterium]
MSNLSVRLLGTYQVIYNGHSLLPFRSNKVQALLAYLLTETGRTHTREQLMTLLWPDASPKASQVNLRQTLYQLRKAIPNVETSDGSTAPLLEANRKSVSLNSAIVYQLDTNDIIHTAQDNIQIETLARVTASYHGHFLADFYLPDNDVFEAWANSKRALYQQHAFSHFETLMSLYLQQENHEKSKQIAQKQLQLDPANEVAYQHLMQSYIGLGQRTAAFATYETCRQHLETELGVPPSAETEAIYQHVRRQHKRNTIPPKTEPDFFAFCLTDIDGYADLSSRFGNQIGPMMQHYNGLIEMAMKRHNGNLMGQAGDSHFIVFEHNNPLPFVLEIQSAILAENWGEMGTFTLSIGLHLIPAGEEGKTVFRQGNEFFGPAVIQTARIAGLANRNQVLASDNIIKYCPYPAQKTWQACGEHTLQGFDGPQPLYILSNRE